MPAEVPFPGAGDPAIGLIETFKWTREGGYALLPEHMERLQRSAAVCGFALRIGSVQGRLDEAAAGFAEPSHRVRLVLFPDGAIALTSAPLAPTAAYRVAVAGPRFRSDDPWLAHKTTMRDRYDGPLADAAARDADEVLFLNEREELCESARANIFVTREGLLWTPPLTCGLLPGTLRAHLLRTGEAREAVLRLADIGPDVRWFLGNSVRGLVPATLLAT